MPRRALSAHGVWTKADGWRQTGFVLTDARLSRSSTGVHSRLCTRRYSLYSHAVRFLALRAKDDPLDLLWQLEPATAAKHRLYKRYLDAWWPILLQPVPPKGYLRPRVTYLDAFAGPGLYEAGEDGSPVFALDRLLNHQLVDRMGLSRDRVHLIFMEKDRRRHEHLCKVLDDRFGNLSDLPVSVSPLRGEAGTDALPALTELSAWGAPILAIFDSWGSVNVPLEVMQRIARNSSSEVIVTFGPNWFSRRESSTRASSMPCSAGEGSGR